MMLLFIMIVASILLGAVFVWLSGYFSASTGGGDAASAAAISLLKKENERLKKVEEEFFDSRKTQVIDNTEKDAEVAKLTSDLARAEGEKDRAQLEIDNLREELELMKKKELSRPSSIPKPPPPTMERPATESEAIDALQAQLDMERVAHQKTKDELAQVKKIAAVKMATAPTFSTTSDSKTGGARFQTMAFSPNRGPGGGGGAADILKGALDKVQAEKDKLQAELDRAQKELQILKMRGGE